MSITSGVTLVMHAEDGTLPCRPEDRAAFVAARRLFELDSYYSAISALTFATEFVTVTRDEAAVWQRVNRGAPLDASAEVLFAQLCAKITAGITRFGADGCFVRLSTRSPKDAVDKLPSRLQPLLQDALCRAGALKGGRPSLLDTNAQYTCLRQAFYDAMRVYSSADVLALVSHSSRSISDLRMALGSTEVAGVWTLGLVVREWVTLPLQGELRGFCSGKVLTALSQYYIDVSYPWLHDNADMVAACVRAFFDSHVRVALPMADCVVDFVVWPNGVVRIVELNPFTPSTGACLFDWQKDAVVLQSGPFEFRHLKSPPAHQAAQLSPWRHLLDDALHAVDPTL